LRAPLTGRSNPLGLKSILKVITLIARSTRSSQKGPGGHVQPGEYDAREDRGLNLPAQGVH
jgi:hypothetical protein